MRKLSANLAGRALHTPQQLAAMSRDELPLVHGGGRMAPMTSSVADITNQMDAAVNLCAAKGATGMSNPASLGHGGAAAAAG